MTRNRSILALIAVLAVVAGGYLAYDNVLRGDSVAPLALPTTSPEATAATTSTPSTPASSDAAGTEPSTTTPTADGEVAGTWTVTTGSEAGYRVRERLANLDAESDAVGRTGDVTGSITVVETAGGAQLTAGEIAIDTTTITSDEDRRDNRLRSEGLQTDQFPTATFTLTQPVDVPAAALAGTATDVTLVGDLTLHGVTRSVEIPAQAALTDGQIQVAGSLTFPLADFDDHGAERRRVHHLDRRRGRPRVPRGVREGLTADRTPVTGGPPPGGPQVTCGAGARRQTMPGMDTTTSPRSAHARPHRILAPLDGATNRGSAGGEPARIPP